MNTSIFICQLSQQKQDLIQKKVKRHLTLEGHTKEYIQEVIDSVMSDRLVNLEEIINVNQFL
jgi:hypothetical protein